MTIEIYHSLSDYLCTISNYRLHTINALLLLLLTKFSIFHLNIIIFIIYVYTNILHFFFRL